MPTVASSREGAVRVLTGGMLPDGADAVVPVEDTDAAPGVAELPSAVAIRGRRRRRARPAGRQRPAGGRSTARCRHRPPAGEAGRRRGGRTRRAVRPSSVRVAVLATGDELVPAGEPPGPAQIPDSNSISIAAQALEAGAEVHPPRHRARRPTRSWSGSAHGHRRADVVVVSGGGSRSVPTTSSRTRSSGSASSSSGGSPSSRASRSPSARPRRTAVDDALLFGLPGNPVSSFVTFELFVRPVLRALAGHRDLVGPDDRASPAGEAVQPAGRRTFLRVRLVPDPGRTGGQARRSSPAARGRTCSRRLRAPTAWPSSPRRCDVACPQGCRRRRHPHLTRSPTLMAHRSRRPAATEDRAPDARRPRRPAADGRRERQAGRPPRRAVAEAWSRSSRRRSASSSTGPVPRATC